MKIIAGIWKIRDEYIKDFIDLSTEASMISRKEDGNINFTFSEDKTEENTFLFFEEWKNQEAIDYHIAQDYFKEFMSKSEKMVLLKPRITIYEIDTQTEL